METVKIKTDPHPYDGTCNLLRSIPAVNFMERDAAAREVLEALVDTANLAATLAQLSDVCAAKAEYIRTDWQDKVAALPWAKLSSLLLKASSIADAERI